LITPLIHSDASPPGFQFLNPEKPLTRSKLDQQAYNMILEFLEVNEAAQSTKQHIDEAVFHRSSSSFALASTTRASDRGPVEIKEISNIFG
jgi:hypothetical protein